MSTQPTKDVYSDKIEFGPQGPDCIEIKNIKPATKIQRDLLFQKMKEAGYEWDAEKKELKTIQCEEEKSKFACGFGGFIASLDGANLTLQFVLCETTSNAKHLEINFGRTDV